MSALTIIEKFVHSIDTTIKVDFDDNFCADVINKTIYIETVEHLDADELIQNFVQEKFNLLLNPFLIGVLHEVGHIMTYDEDKDIERSIMYGLLSMGYTDDKKEKYSQLYFSIPAEFEATSWAVNYYIKNTQKCEDFLDELFCR